MIDFIYKYEPAIRLSVFLGGFSLLALWEWAKPRRVLSQVKLKRWFSNFTLVVLGAVLVRIIVPTAAIGVAYLVEQRQWGFANHFELPFWLKVFITFILLDLTIYFQHAMFHVLPVMWRLHRVHHSDLDCDITTGLRFHPIEILISILIKIFTIIVLGAPVLAVVLFEVVLNLLSMFTHSNIRLNKTFEGVLRWFVVTPDMHRVHHSVRENETNSNFAFNISLWDRIFGTYLAKPKDGQQGMVIGLDQFREPEWQGLRGLIYMPFVIGIRGYTINYRDTKNEDELALARELAFQNQEKAKLAAELSTYINAIDQHALVSATDPDGQIIMVNDKFCETSGYSREELLGQDHRIINSGVHPNTLFDELWATIKSGNIWHGEICDRAKNGTLYWVDSTIVPLKNEDGEIERYISVRLDVTERKRHSAEITKAYQELTKANGQLEQLSRTDGLTNIANRRYFDETLLNEISRQSRQQSPLTLILCDLDYFKEYNDTYGHQAGDVCLQKIAQVINSAFPRSCDLVARYGGEEFAIILPDVDKKAALMLAERLCANVKKLKLPHSSGINKVVTLSAGITSLIPDNNITMYMIIDQADKALYTAKEKGRNNVQCFN